MAGVGRDRMGRKARSSRGSGLQSVPLIQRFSGPLMGLVRENHQGERQGERPGCALPISEWRWAGLLGWTSEASAMLVNLEALALCLSALYQRGLQECAAAHGSSEREGPF